MSDITFTASVPPRWSDEKVKAVAAKAGNPWMAAAMRSVMLEMRYDYEGERLQLLLRITSLEAELVSLRQTYAARLVPREDDDDHPTPH